MKGRLVSPHGLLAALYFAAVGFAGGACSDSKQQTDPITEGPPTILQVFVDSVSGNGLEVNDPSGGTPGEGAIDGNDLIYGLQPNIGMCSFDLQCPAGSNLTCKHFMIQRLEADLCVSADDTQPGVTDGEPLFPIIQFVFKELLDGSTVEGFECDCNSVGSCNGGKIFTADQTCSDCPDSADTPNDDESGRCTDIDGDGVNDHPILLPGVYTLECDNGLSYTNDAGDGGLTAGTGGDPGTYATTSYYDPAGNQFVPIDSGFEGIGPRLRFTPPGPLPAGATCTITLGSGVTDKEGNAVPATTRALTWTVAGVAVLATAPEEDEEDVPIVDADDNPLVVAITFNTVIGEVTADAITVSTGGVDVPGTVSISEDDPTTVIFTPTVPFIGGTTYDVTVGTGISDLFGVSLGAGQSFSFTTATP